MKKLLDVTTVKAVKLFDSQLREEEYEDENGDKDLKKLNQLLDELKENRKVYYNALNNCKTKTQWVQKNVFKTELERAINKGLLPYDFPLFYIFKTLKKNQQFDLLTKLKIRFYGKSLRKEELYELDLDYLKTLTREEIDEFLNNYDAIKNAVVEKVYDVRGNEIKKLQEFQFCYSQYSLYYRESQKTRYIVVKDESYGLLYNDTFYPIDSDTHLVDLNCAISQVIKKVKTKKMYGFKFANAKFGAAGERGLTPFDIELAKKMIIAYLNIKSIKKYNRDLEKGRNRKNKYSLLEDSHEEGKWEKRAGVTSWDLNISLFQEYQHEYTMRLTDYIKDGYSNNMTKKEYVEDGDSLFFNSWHNNFMNDYIEQLTGKSIEDNIAEANRVYNAYSNLDFDDYSFLEDENEDEDND